MASLMMAPLLMKIKWKAATTGPGVFMSSATIIGNDAPSEAMSCDISRRVNRMTVLMIPRVRRNLFLGTFGILDVQSHRFSLGPLDDNALGLVVEVHWSSELWVVIQGKIEAPTRVDSTSFVLNLLSQSA